MGINKCANIVHIVDFRLSKEFRDPLMHQHIPLSKGLGFIGTAAFASINCHLGLELGRWDNLESLAYIFIYFLCGSLPWGGLKSKGCDSVLKSKQCTSVHEFCHWLPIEFGIFLKYSSSLSFTDKSDYNYLCGLFNALLPQQMLQNDLVYDWDALNSQSVVKLKERVTCWRQNAHPGCCTG
jgi:hypothetical protein